MYSTEVPTHLKGKRFSKQDICYILVDQNVNLANPGQVKPIKGHTLKKWMLKRKALFEDLFATINDYDRIKYFSATQSELILSELL